MFSDIQGVAEQGRTSLLEDHHLLELARAGDDDAYAALFTRYRHPAQRLARHLAPATEADDIVAETFTQVLDQINRGKGPDRAFRAYLFTSIRHEAGRRARQRQRVTPTDDLARIDRAVPFGNGQLDSFERELVRQAYDSLPDRWRTVLWYLDVEGLKPHELAERLELKPNSVSALVYRARAGLREAYLAQHVAAQEDDLPGACREVRPRLAAIVRRSAGMREQRRIHLHLETCPDCMAAYLEVDDVNSRSLGDVPAASVAGTTMLASVRTLATTARTAVSLGLAASVMAVAVVSASSALPASPAHAGLVSDVPRYPDPIAEPVEPHGAVAPVGPAGRAPAGEQERTRPPVASAPAPAASVPHAPEPAAPSAAPEPGPAPAPAPVPRPVGDVASPVVRGVVDTVAGVTRSTVGLADQVVSGLLGPRG